MLKEVFTRLNGEVKTYFGVHFTELRKWGTKTKLHSGIFG
jgi:hypothetical protein